MMDKSLERYLNKNKVDINLTIGFWDSGRKMEKGEVQYLIMGSLWNAAH